MSETKCECEATDAGVDFTCCRTHADAGYAAVRASDTEALADELEAAADRALGRMEIESLLRRAASALRNKK